MPCALASVGASSAAAAATATASRRAISSSGSVYVSWLALLQPVASSLELISKGCARSVISTEP